MKVRIVSDGTPRGTQVVTEDGQTISGVVSLVWSMESVTQEATVQMQLIRVPVELVGELQAWQVETETANGTEVPTTDGKYSVLHVKNLGVTHACSSCGAPLREMQPGQWGYQPGKWECQNECWQRNDDGNTDTAGITEAG